MDVDVESGKWKVESGKWRGSGSHTCDEPVALFRPMRVSIIVRVSFGTYGHMCFP